MEEPNKICPEERKEEAIFYNWWYKLRCEDEVFVSDSFNFVYENLFLVS